MQIFQGDALNVLSRMPAKSINCCVTSPPYYGLRDYGVAGQIGLEPTPDEYVGKLVEVFREVRRAMRDDGTLWLNLGDSYSSGGNQGHHTGDIFHGHKDARGILGYRKTPGFRPKNLLGIPWRVAFALQADGWYLRQDIIWHKPNPMPESVKDRCTKSHEYLFLLSKSEKYYFDADAVKEQTAESTKQRLQQPGLPDQIGSARVPWKTNGNMKAVGDLEYRNRRSVWTIATRPYKEAHFAVFPPALVEPCILAGCPAGGVVLDPFAGSGTTLQVAMDNGRDAIGVELNPEYVGLIKKRVGVFSAC